MKRHIPIGDFAVELFVGPGFAFGQTNHQGHGLVFNEGFFIRLLLPPAGKPLLVIRRQGKQPLVDGFFNRRKGKAVEFHA